MCKHIATLTPVAAQLCTGSEKGQFFCTVPLSLLPFLLKIQNLLESVHLMSNLKISLLMFSDSDFNL